MSLSAPAQALYIGLMSGTSLDGVDGVLASFDAQRPQVLASAAVPMPEALREALLALQASGPDEIEREAQAAQALMHCYAECVAALLARSGLPAAQIRAIGAHGQTIRHRPERGYTRQSGAPALLAELSGIDVIADFRSRDIAAGGEGAPLVPAFHQEVFGAPSETRVICNIGGISNLTVLEAGRTVGFDSGPGNVFLDAWASRHLGRRYDEDGRFAAAGTVDATLLAACLDEGFFSRQPPKSTGRDLFDNAWLARRLASLPAPLAPADVQATLSVLSATAIARDVARHAPACANVTVCGGGALNPVLMSHLGEALRQALGHPVPVQRSDALGVPPLEVEALAFAWLARRFDLRQPGNLPAVTGAAGPRILGALYPA